MRRKPEPSPRALELLELIAGGMTLVQAGRHLYITESTAKTHMQQIHWLLGARTTPHAVAVALAEGLIQGPAPRTPEQRDAHLRCHGLTGHSPNG